MKGTLLIRTAVAATATAAVLSGTALPAAGASNDAAQARQATAAYQDSSVITGDAAWGQLYDRDGITCIDNPAGGMGIHFVNPARIGDAQETASAPEAVIYEPQANGDLRLVALEYVVTKQAWEEAGHTAPPRLFEQDFELVRAGNRYGLPDFYELHAWIWRHNPTGMNEDWNPRVSCSRG
ncbi:MAG: hypothetical protein JJD92_03600 [Frankiaceae bacterium]|nr:hypothetical protein [Frankiaceae bacterium]